VLDHRRPPERPLEAVVLREALERDVDRPLQVAGLVSTM
jgi:hypothetical protein